MLILNGCGTTMIPRISGVSDNSSQTIHVQAVASNNSILQNTSCSIRDGNNHLYHVIGNPGRVSVLKDKNPLTITCRKVGYKQTKVGVSDSFNAWASGKMTFWPGTTVDAESGAVVKYPSYLTIVMVKE